VNSARIEVIAKATAHPDSHSVATALTQVWNEVAQEHGETISDLMEQLSQLRTDHDAAVEGRKMWQGVAEEAARQRDAALATGREAGLREAAGISANKFTLGVFYRNAGEQISADILAAIPSSKEGCTCQGCGEKYHVDFSVTDEVWEAIKPKGKPEGAGLLCGKCIIERLSGLAAIPSPPKGCETAREFAARAHEGQTYGPGEPYTAHLDAVVALVGDDEVTRVVAFLHDVVEDTPVTLQEVKAKFGEFVAECVALVTDEPGANRKERKSATHAKLAKIVDPPHHVALIVKTADRAANVEACVRKGNHGLLQMYQREQEAFRLAVYRPGICDHLWSRIDAALATISIKAEEGKP
jgi:hypothetical protein